MRRLQPAPHLYTSLLSSAIGRLCSTSSGATRSVAADTNANQKGSSTELAHVSPKVNSDGNGEEELSWGAQMEVKYGEGTWKLFRPLYKDLVDEMRREMTTKPPQPLKDWSTRHDTKNNVVVFEKDPAEGMGRVWAYSKLVIASPPRLHQGMTFADFCPIEALVERKGIVAHFSVCLVEDNLHLRNVRMCTLQSMDKETLFGTTPDQEWNRTNLLYDGPCINHLELRVQNELHEIMMDQGITVDWLRWATNWVHYLEHVEFVKWTLKMMDHVIPEGKRGPEADFLTNEEMDELSLPTEDWLPVRYN